MKELKDLIDTNLDITVRGICEDSRLVKKGYIFVATKGYNVDHYDYIDEAIEKGCVFVICDRNIKNNFPHLVVDNIDKEYRELCKKYYDLEIRKYQFIGITGTDGKTTTTSIVKRLIDNCAYIGTLGLLTNNRWYKTNNTTPCISELYQNISRVKENTIAMEVSSEALIHHRVDDIKYKVVGITNITGDHLNIHKTFEDYVKAKLSIIEKLDIEGLLIVNGDDPILNNIVDKRLVKFGFEAHNDFIIKDIKYSKNGSLIHITHNSSSLIIESPMKGRYNVYNVVMAYIIARFFGVDNYLLQNRIKRLRPIKGRSEYLNFGQKYDIVLDYAHTVNAVKSLLESVSNYNDIIVVSGCAGGRDKAKRPIIGEMIIKMSTCAIFTMDDPRFEDVDDIIDQMAGKYKNYYRIIDREDAINYALNIAREESIVLIIGKGRDDYMAIRDKKIHYCDYDIIHNYFNKN